MTEGRSMVNPSQWVDSARDNGYKNAAMALGELIDNSLQAGASNVEVLVGEQLTKVNKRNMWQVKEIGILDNGVGMDADLALMDTAKTYVVRAAESESGQGYTPFEGSELTGKVVSTYLRGELVYDSGQVIGPARGQYLSRPC